LWEGDEVADLALEKACERKSFQLDCQHVRRFIDTQSLFSSSAFMATIYVGGGTMLVTLRHREERVSLPLAFVSVGGIESFGFGEVCESFIERGTVLDLET